MRAVRLFAAVSVAGLAAGLAAPAFADDGDIVVNARRFEERLQDVPIAISVVSQEEISERNITSPTELGQYVPSLGTDQRYGGDTATFTMRGFYQEAASAPTVGVYFADAVSPRGNSVTNTPSGDGVNAGNLFDLQNVQVLKGPQGTLFGRNTTGGAILLVPQKPTDRLEGYVEGSVGNYNLRRVQAVINIPLAETFKIRLGVDRQKRDGWQRNISGVGPAKMGSSDYWAFRGSIVADLTPDLENYTVFSYANSDPVPVVNSAIACNEGPASATGLQGFVKAFGLCRAQVARAAAAGFNSVQNFLPDPQQEMKQWQVVNTTTWHASDTLTIKNIASYAEFTANYRSSIFGENYIIDPATVSTGSAFLDPLVKGIAAKYAGSRFLIAQSSFGPAGPSASQSTFSEEIQFQGNAGNLTWQAGVYYEASNPLKTSGSETLGTATCTDHSTSPVCGDIYRDYVANLTDLGDGVLDGLLVVPNFGTFPVLALVPPIAKVNTATARIKYRNFGIYAQGTYRFSDKFAITAGIRYSRDTVTGVAGLTTADRGTNPFAPVAAFPIGGFASPNRAATRCVYGTLPNGTPSLPGCLLNYKVKSDAPTWLIDFEFTPNDNTLLYAKYTRGYRQGGIQPRSATPTFEPEKIDAFEVGGKFSFNTGGLSGVFNLAAFYNRLSNQQLQSSYDVSSTFYQSLLNVGKSRVYGLEADTNLRAGILSLNAAVAYLNTKIISAPNVADLVTIIRNATGFANPNISTFPLQGDPLPLTPKWRVSITPAIDIPIPESAGTLTLSGTMIHTSETFVTSADGFDGPNSSPNHNEAITLFNANLTWREVGGSPIDLSFFVTNLTNKKYYAAFLGGWQSVGSETGRQGMPRMWGGRARFTFGK